MRPRPIDVGNAAQSRIAAARSGDHAAFRRLVEPHLHGLYRVSVRILGDPALAEDAVQEALWNAYRGLDRFDERASFSTWLHRIQVNAALSIRRSEASGFSSTKRVEDQQGDGLDDVVDEAPVPSEVANARRLGGAITGALDRLTPLERTAFVLRHLEQYSLEEIATVLESNGNACKQAIFRAVRKLRPALAAWRGES